MNWQKITSADDVLMAVEHSKKPGVNAVAIFKHSTRCGISSMVKNRLETKVSVDEEKVPIYLLDLLSHRETSNFISEHLGIRHESPQLIIISGGKVIHHASHMAVEAESLNKLNN